MTLGKNWEKRGRMKNSHRLKIAMVLSIGVCAMEAVAQNSFPSSGNVVVTGNVQINTPGVNSGNGLYTGNGDGANASTVDVAVESWWGLGFKTTCCANSGITWNYPIVFDPRAGNIYAEGYVGIGTTTPTAPLNVVGPALGSASGNSIPLLSLQNSNGNQNFLNISQIRNSNGTDWTTATTRMQITTDVTPQGYIDFNPAGGTYGLAFGSGGSELMRIVNGNVGVGTTSPGAKLEVDGSVKLTSGSGASITFQDGTVQSTAYTGVTCGGDFAESVDVSGSRASYEPGDVLVIGANSGSDVAKSSEPYSTLVVGVYSTKPGVVGRRQTTGTKTSTTAVPMAMVGIVPTKVSAENGAIKRGDLLVTSSTAGYAMKGTDRSLLAGAVLGKALGALDSGTGVIEAVITLQ
jgi:hypothetical protein